MSEKKDKKEKVKSGPVKFSIIWEDDGNLLIMHGESKVKLNAEHRRRLRLQLEMMDAEGFSKEEAENSGEPDSE